ncbi:MAG: glycosyltransferase family 1 protein [Candidatus Buchananbacteria bacterium]
MKIVIDARMYGAQSTTGIGAYIKNLTDQLFLIDQKNEYVLLMKEPAYSEFIVPNLRIKKIKVDIPWYSLSEQIKLPWILLRQKADLVHFPHFNASIFYPKKFIVTIHDITPKFFPGPLAKKRLIRKWGYDFIFKTTLKRADKIIAISEHTKKNLIDNFSVNKDKIITTYLGVSPEFMVPKSEKEILDLKTKYKITKPFIFYVGVWRDHKNLPGLIFAFDELKNHYQLDCQLVLGGKQDFRYPEISQAIKNSKHRSDIILPGFIAENELIAFYQAAKLFVLPSFCEGFGLVALEAMALGTPVAGSNTTSLPEILQDAAIYFNPKDHLAMAKVFNQILTDKNLYQDLKTRGLEQVKKYNWTNCASQTLNIYQS